MALKTTMFFLLALACLTAGAAASRDLPTKPGYDLSSRLEAARGGGGGVLVECWNALIELKSCSNEIVLFFLNGQTDIGPGCCGAIDIITRNCWPAMLNSLGFTAEEGNILRGYCDASASASSGGPAAAVAPLASAN